MARVTRFQKMGSEYINMLQQKLKSIKEQSGATNNVRIIENLFGSSVKEFENAFYNYNIAQKKIQNKIESNLFRQAEIVLNKDLSAEEKSQIVENPKLIQEMVEKQLSGQKAHSVLKNAYSDLQERHKDIMMIESSVEKVHKLIFELATLVSIQGSIIDNVEKNIAQAKNYVFDGELDIFKADENMKSARKVLF